MNLKKRLALGVFISTLLAFSAYYAEYLPFTGKWIAAYRMDRYAQEQYPGFHCGKVYFNPCGAPYEAMLTGDSGQEVELGCGYDGLIGDPLVLPASWHSACTLPPHLLYLPGPIPAMRPNSLPALLPFSPGGPSLIPGMERSPAL